jgi:serine/threonine protein kinase
MGPRPQTVADGLFEVGDVIAGKYRLEQILGFGGMGVVVAAMHLELEQRVALKFMLPHAMTSPEATERFVREARAAARLRSEHICRVLDVDKLESGVPYIVMELMEGEDLASLLARRGSLPLSEAVDLVLQALAGLAEAHLSHIVHRDLKPANLFIANTRNGSRLVKLLDFGISKSMSGGGATKTGDIMGSPSYMAPEQLRSSKDVDQRADLWAIGVILFEAVSGGSPFEADSLPALCVSVLHDAPPSLDTVTSVPPDFARLVTRCLEKDRGGRFADVGDLAAALAAFGTAEGALTAARITKLMLRTPSQEPEPTPQDSDREELGDAAAPPPTAAPVQRIGLSSTFSASAAESLLIAGARRPRRVRLFLFATAAAIAGTALAVFILVARRAHTDEPMPRAVHPTLAPEPLPPTPAAPRAIDPSPHLDPPAATAPQVGAPEAPPPSAVPATRSHASRPPSKRTVSGSTQRIGPLITTPPVQSPPQQLVPPTPPPQKREETQTKPLYKGTKGTLFTEYPPGKE